MTDDTTAPEVAATTLPMTVADVDTTGRTVEGVCVPYERTSYLVPYPGGERVVRGAFRGGLGTRDLTARPVFLFRDHDHRTPVGRAQRFTDEPDGLHGTFTIRAGQRGDDTLTDLRDGYLPSMSVGFRPIRTRRGGDGATEVVDAELLEVSLVSIPAYDEARVLALRRSPRQQRPRRVPAVVSWTPPLSAAELDELSRLEGSANRGAVATRRLSAPVAAPRWWVDLHRRYPDAADTVAQQLYGPR